MTRPGSRDHGRTPDTSRPAASYTTGTPDRHTPMRQCACGAAYRDTDDSRTAHHTVFGHRPIRKPAPEQGDQT